MEEKPGERNRMHEARERLEALLLAGLDSGDPIEVTDAYVRRKRKELLTRMRGAAGPNDR